MASTSPLGAAHRVARETAHALVSAKPQRDSFWQEGAEIALAAAILQVDDPTPANVADLLRNWATGTQDPPQSLRQMFGRTRQSILVLALDALPRDADADDRESNF